MNDIILKDKYLTHVMYEIEMIYFNYKLRTKHILFRSEDPNDAIGFRDSVFVSFLLHFRNLSYFFNNKLYDSDIRISSFIEGCDISAYSFSYEKERIDKCLAHITKDRLGYESHEGFNFDEMFITIMNKSILFLQYLCENRLSNKLTEINYLKTELENYVKAISNS